MKAEITQQKNKDKLRHITHRFITYVRGGPDRFNDNAFHDTSSQIYIQCYNQVYWPVKEKLFRAELRLRKKTRRKK